MKWEEAKSRAILNVGLEKKKKKKCRSDGAVRGKIEQKWLSNRSP